MSSKEKTHKIHQFNPQIYPRLLWIAVGVPIDVIRDMFGKDTAEMDDDAAADCANVFNEKTKKGGILIRFRSTKEMTPSIMAHESTHAAIEIFDYSQCCISHDNQEPFAYLVGRCVDCCHKVRINKFDDD